MFRFRLEPLISIRDNELKACQEELAKAYHAKRILEESLHEIEQQLEEGIAAVRNQVQAGQMINVEYLLGFRRQEAFLRANQDDLMQKMHIIDEEIERRRLALLSAHKDLKIVEKLKENRLAKYQTEAQKAETTQMDEIAGNRRYR